MRYLHLAIMLLLLSVSSNAQNYNPLQPGTVKYFWNDHSRYVRGMRIDSITYSGNDIIYHPFRTPRGGGSFFVRGGCWLGKTIIRKPDGTFLFDNLWGNDTAVIRTQAALGDSWVFHHVPLQTRYMASVTAIDTMSFMGFTDSVKTIRINAYDLNNNILTNDSLNNYEVILSKNHGFVQAFDIYTFPYHPPGQQYGMDLYMDANYNYGHGRYLGTFRVINFQFSPGSTYDKQVGDIYEYTMGDLTNYNTSLNSYYMDTIISTGPIRSNGWSSEPYPMGHHTTTFHTNSYSQYYPVEVYYNSALLPEEHKQFYYIYYNPNDTSYCRASAGYGFRTNSLYFDDTSAMLPGFDNINDSYNYKDGLGMVMFYTQTYMGLYSSRKLLYYSKNGVTCGVVKSAQSLPIKLTSIIATNEQVYNRINWDVEQEATGDAYELERSRDGKFFTKIALVHATGKAPVTYTHLDRSPVEGENYYRIKSVDINGEFVYSRVVSAFAGKVVSSDIAIYPNPATKELVVRTDAKHFDNAVIVNHLGQQVTQKALQGTETVIDIHELPSGLYFIRLEGDSGMEMRKFIKR